MYVIEGMIDKLLLQNEHFRHLHGNNEADGPGCYIRIIQGTKTDVGCAHYKSIYLEEEFEIFFLPLRKHNLGIRDCIQRARGLT